MAREWTRQPRPLRVWLGAQISVTCPKVVHLYLVINRKEARNSLFTDATLQFTISVAALVQGICWELTTATSLVAQTVKHLPTMRETRVQSLGSGRSPREGNGNPLQYCCLENPMDRRAWYATVHGDAKRQTWLSNFTLSNKSSHCTLQIFYNFADYTSIKLKKLIFKKMLGGKNHQPRILCLEKLSSKKFRKNTKVSNKQNLRPSVANRLLCKKC